MGDLGELRGLLTTVTFLGVFALLITFMVIPVVNQKPSTQNRKELSVPSYFEAINIQYFAKTYLVNVTTWGNPQTYTFDIGGWHVGFEIWGSFFHVIRAYTYDKFLFITYHYHDFEWHDVNGIRQSSNYIVSFISGEWLDWKKLDTSYEEQGTNGLRWSIQNPVTEMIVYMGFNETKYKLPSDAILNNDCAFLFCMNFDKINTSFNAWNIIGMMLFFQMPDINPVINCIIAIPIWVTIGYLIFTFITKVIPFLGD